MAAVALVLAMLVAPLAAFAGGPGTGSPPDCLVVRPSAGALAIRGTIAVEAQSSGAGATDVDFTLRLARSGVTNFFRATRNTVVFGLSNEEILCVVLDDPTISGQILQAFGLSSTRRLVITDKSITNADAPGTNQVFPSGRASNIADVTIWAQ